MVFNDKSKNVLVLEDIPFYKDKIVEFVGSFGYTPFTSTNRQDFVQSMNEFDYFATILDNNVPYDRNGFPEKDIGLSLVSHFLRNEKGVRVALHTECGKTPEIESYEKQGLIYLLKPASRIFWYSGHAFRPFSIMVCRKSSGR